MNGQLLEGKIEINGGFYCFLFRSRVYLYLKVKRIIVIVTKEVKMIAREAKYLKKLERYVEHGFIQGEDRYLQKKLKHKVMRFLIIEFKHQVLGE